MGVGVFIMLVGLPASGKSNLSKLYEENGCNVHSSDKIRLELFDNINYMGENDLVFETLHNRVIADLKDGNSVVYDACNTSYKKRMAFLRSISDIDCIKTCIILATSYEECIRRNALRERTVPLKIIEKMYHNIDIPFYSEGWDIIEIKYSENLDYSESELLSNMLSFEQDNPNHRLSLGQHCLETMKNVPNEYRDVQIAGFYHDIGKLKTKSYKDNKGQIGTVAHYYNHENVSAYDFLLYALENEKEEVLEIAKLIRWHMLYYNDDILNRTKTKNRYINKLGKDFMDKLMILHKADKLAH